jgi:hypothetical protein
MEEAKKKEPRKITVLLDPDLEKRLCDERAKVSRETGLKVSMNQIAARAMRAGFEVSRKS